MATSVTRADERGSARGGNVPVPLTSLVGRDRDLDGVSEVLRRTRLVTLTGPGGVGKTRLATELARRQIGRREEVWLVDLTLTAQGRDPAAELARALGVGGGSAPDPTEWLVRYLRDRDTLLVLDNCEHVIDGCAQLAACLVGSCARVRILATSRESLGVTGETVWRLDPLAPEDAQRLFVERARQREPRFVPGHDVSAAIAAVCERLDRLPLAIELAAARIGALSPGEILSGLEAWLAGVGGGPRLAPARHRTVRAAVAWSYALLDAGEQRALRSLAVFVGGFDAAAAMAVAPGLTMDVFERLVDKSVVAVRHTAQGRTRYRLLQTVREFAHELLVAGGELDAARDRHLHHFSALEEGAEPGWPSARAEALLSSHEDDYENVRAALERAVESDPCAGIRLFAAIHDLFVMLGQADGRRIAQQLLERCPARDRNRVAILVTAGLLAMLTATPRAAEALLIEAAELAAELGEPALEGFALLHHGVLQLLNEGPEAARAQIEAARAVFREARHVRGEGVATAAYGLILTTTGDPARGRELLEAAVAMHTAAGFRWGEGHARLYLGIALGQSDEAAASAHFRKAVDCFVPYREATLLPYALIGQAKLIARRDPVAALQVIAAATAMRERIGGGFPPLYGHLQREAKASCEAALSGGAERVWAAGTRLRADEAIALAFGRSRPRAAPVSGLSPRELDVVGLVAQGLPNKSIAAQLHLSVRTVESHVRSALAKAGLQNRTQLAAWALEHVQ